MRHATGHFLDCIFLITPVKSKTPLICHFIGQRSENGIILVFRICIQLEIGSPCRIGA